MPARLSRFFIPMLAVLLLPQMACADSLDEAALADDFLAPMARGLDENGIDVLYNLNDRSLARGRVEQPRLGRFPDLPVPSYPGSRELQIWEADYAQGNLGGLALLKREAALSTTQFRAAWLDSADSERLFVTFASADAASAAAIAELASTQGWQPLLFTEGREHAGLYYATTAQRLAIDSEQARDYRGELPELAWLGERLRRNEESLFREPGNRGDRGLARNEPSVFLKESLGDEFSESTIREIIVPGGVALGETARIPASISAVHFRDEQLYLGDEGGKLWSLPAIASTDLKALFDFAHRASAIASDAIVDIDERGRVSMSSALRDTDPGYYIMVADRVPFDYVRNLSVSKSVIIDTDVNWQVNSTAAQALGFTSGFEVRFLSADNMRLAQTRVALVYDYDSESDMASYDEAWGRDARRLRENLNYSGLGEELKVVANYAGWIGMWRTLLEENIQFTHGRYEFMKLDSRGRETPSRY